MQAGKKGTRERPRPVRGRPWKAGVWAWGACVCVVVGGRVPSMRDLRAEFTSGPVLVTMHVIPISVCARVCARAGPPVCLRRSSLGSLRVVVVSELLEPRAAPMAIGAQDR